MYSQWNTIGFKEIYNQETYRKIYGTRKYCKARGGTDPGAKHCISWGIYESYLQI